jgi:glycosyltransferase involved in cell wall biosynthesis
MELRFDLSWDQSTASSDYTSDSGRRILRFADLTTIVRRPGALALLLWRTRYDAVVMVEDGLPKSGKQAGALLIGSFARARRRRVETPTGIQELWWPRFIARALSAIAVAVPRELWRSRALRRRAAGVVEQRPRLPRHAARTDSLIYLRGEPRWRSGGAFIGGAATHTTGVVNAFIANGLSTRVYACQEPPGLDAPVTKLLPRRIYHFDPWLTLVELSEDFVRAADRESADFVYQRYALGSYAGVELARRLDVPFVLEYNGSELWIARHWSHRKVAKRGVHLKDRFENRMVRDASLNVVGSDPLRDELIAAGVDPDRILVNPNGVDVDRLAPFRDRAPREWRAKHRLPDAPTVGFVGTFGLWHGVDLLPAMIDRVHQLVPDAHWVIVGEGSLFDEVRDAIHDRGGEELVFMPGSVTHEQALELLAASDVCVSPHVQNPDGSRFFFSPIKLFEYMGLAKAIVASDLEQIADVIEHDRTGLLCTPGSVDEAAAAVATLLGDESRRSRLGGAALREASDHYTWDAHVGRILEALRP